MERVQIAIVTKCYCFVGHTKQLINIDNKMYFFIMMNSNFDQRAMQKKNQRHST